MLAKLRLYLREENDDLGYNSSPLFHGVLMEQVSPEYGEYLHRAELKPFSQHISKEEGQWVWKVNTLDRDAYTNIVMPLLSADFLKINLKHKKLTLAIEKKEIAECVTYDEFVKRWYLTPDSLPKYTDLKFLTPVSFRQNGHYIFMPDVRLMLQSLMHKYDVATSAYSVYDEETLEDLTRHCFIEGYRLKSVRFFLESARIPGFIGELAWGFRGSAPMRSLLSLLLHYSTFSGMGIKAALGMGAVEIFSKTGRSASEEVL